MSGQRGGAVAALALLWAFAGCCWVLPDGAYAADFIVKNCSDEMPAYAVDALYEGGGRVEGRHCNDAGSPGQMQLNGRGGATAAGEYGSWVWQAGSGAGIVGASIQARLRNAGGWAAQLYALRRDGTTDLFGTASDGAFAGYHLSEAGAGPAGAARVVAQLKCYRLGGCDLATLGGATARPDDVQLTVRDDEPPSATAAGPLLEANAETRWHRGVEEVSISADDTGSGIGSWWMRIDGTRAAGLGSQACPGDRGAYAVSTRPCPASASARFPVDTAGLSAGSHSVELCAADYGGAAANLGCSRSYAIRVDNAAPLQPRRLGGRLQRGAAGTQRGLSTWRGLCRRRRRLADRGQVHGAGVRRHRQHRRSPASAFPPPLASTTCRSRTIRVSTKQEVLWLEERHGRPRPRRSRPCA